MATQPSGGEALSLNTDNHPSDNTKDDSRQIKNFTVGDDVSGTNKDQRL